MSLDEVIGNNTISSKVSSTERLVKKQNKNTKIILITLYVIIMTFLIVFTIHYLTKRDFTSEYQTEFKCYKKEDKNTVLEISVTGNPLITFKEDHNYYKYDTEETKKLRDEFIDPSDYVYGDYYITICEYDGKSDGCFANDMYAGSDIGTALNSVITLKKVYISNGYICY